MVNRETSDPNRVVLIIATEAERARDMRVTPQEMYRGFRAERLMGQDVYGPNGNRIGEVQDIFVNAQGQITAVTVEAGGFLDIGDAAFRVK